MIRSTKVSLKFANIGKCRQLDEFRQEFRRVAVLYIQELHIENIKNLRYKTKSVPRFLKGFTYPCILGKLESFCTTNGVRVVHKDPAYTSQRCSKCGLTQKANRSGRKFVCKACGFVCDADVNAACNIACELPEISAEFRSRHPNLQGFWFVERKESVAPFVQKVNFGEKNG